MTTNFLRALSSGALLLGLLGAAPAAFHVHLTRSEPRADSTLAAAPAAIKLWFSAPIELSVTSVHVTDAANHAVTTAAATQAPGANQPIVFPVTGRLSPGRYSVAWRTMSRDAHLVRGTFAFTVAPAVAPARTH
jgi:methionine-rich copper-binding protein CopC